MPRHQFTAEDASEMGRKGGLAKKTARRKRDADPLTAIKRELPNLFEDLLRAARGQAPFDTLPPDKRLAALFRVIEYGAGKPVGLDKSTPDAGSPDGPQQEPERLEIA